MSMNHLWALALAGASFVSPLSGGIHADAVVEYVPGSGAAAALNDPLNALGEPSRVTSGPFGGAVDPFNPAYQGSQLVSIGAGGSLTVQFSTPLRNEAGNPFGLDFVIFGNAGFVITNDFDPVNFTYVGTPATDGTLFGAGTGNTRIWVSEDGVTFYTLDPAHAPMVDGLFPTYGAGDFQVPVNPALTAGDFAGATLEEIRTRYAGSAGGTGYDLAWALTDNGQPANLDQARFVRIEVLSDKAEIDGIVMVPEPSTWWLALGGAVVLLGGRRVLRGNHERLP